MPVAFQLEDHVVHVEESTLGIGKEFWMDLLVKQVVSKFDDIVSVVYMAINQRELASQQSMDHLFWLQLTLSQNNWLAHIKQFV